MCVEVIIVPLLQFSEGMFCVITSTGHVWLVSWKARVMCRLCRRRE